VDFPHFQRKKSRVNSEKKSLKYRKITTGSDDFFLIFLTEKGRKNKRKEGW